MIRVCNNFIYTVVCKVTVNRKAGIYLLTVGMSDKIRNKFVTTERKSVTTYSITGDTLQKTCGNQKCHWRYFQKICEDPRAMVSKMMSQKWKTEHLWDCDKWQTKLELGVHVFLSVVFVYHECPWSDVLCGVLQLPHSQKKATTKASWKITCHRI